MPVCVRRSSLIAAFLPLSLACGAKSSTTAPNDSGTHDDSDPAWFKFAATYRETISERGSGTLRLASGAIWWLRWQLYMRGRRGRYDGPHELF
jgi:hypothetical protein